MLKRLRFKNWRSLRDVTIDDIGPITVLIGANSSGKSNIVGAIDFLRGVFAYPEQAFFVENRQPVLTIGAKAGTPIELEAVIKFPDAPSEATYTLAIQSRGAKTHFGEHLAYSNAPYRLDATDGTGKFAGKEGIDALFVGVEKFPGLVFAIADPQNPAFIAIAPEASPTQVWRFLTEHFQILREGFWPPARYPMNDLRSLVDISPDASNTALMLDYMSNSHPDLYEKLVDDLRWLMPHIQTITPVRERGETRIRLFEPYHNGLEAPIISQGTSRLMAILTAYYALELRNSSYPGLVVIEEPDMAIHPQLLKNFVELIRGYTEDEAHPRQFIFTTHNPRFLDYFDPKEVRVVRRDEQGYTIVEKIPEYIRDIWLDKYGLGEVWMTRSLGDSD